MMRFLFITGYIATTTRTQLRKTFGSRSRTSTAFQRNFPLATSDLRSSSVTMEKLQEDEDRESFLQWARSNAIPITSVNPNDVIDKASDLEAMAAAIGGSEVVVLSEGFHNCREMMSLHHRIIRYLVEHHGFNTVVTESGLPESRLIWDHIQGHSNHDKDTATASAKENMYKKGVNKMYGEWVEGRNLIEWMKEYNLSHNNALHYYGTDIGGFYQDWKTPLNKIIEYLNLVDGSYSNKLKADLQPYLDVMSEKARVNYSEKLSPLERARLEILLDEALQKFDSEKEGYIKLGGETEYEWARQSLESMRLAEAYYRNYLERCNPEVSKDVGLNGREIAMCRNVLWAIDQRKRLGDAAAAKVIVIHHVIHTKTESQYQDKLWGFFTPAGQMLRQALGDDKLYVIGMVYGGGYYWKNWQKGRQERIVAEIPPAHDDGLEQTLLKIGDDCCFIPWKNTKHSELYPWWLSSLCTMRENDYFINIRPREWDACIFMRDVNPATAVSPT